MGAATLRTGSTAAIVVPILVFLLGHANLTAALPAISHSMPGSLPRKLAGADSCGGESKACITCDALTAKSILSRESRSIRNIFNALVEDVQLMKAQVEDLLRKGGVSSVRTSLDICDDGPGSLRPPDYCGENSSQICPGTWTGNATCTERCEERDWGNMRNWPPGTYLGHADCDLDREAELWAGTVFMEDLRRRFVVNGSDVNDTGHNGSWIGNRTREMDLAVADNVRNLMPKLAARNSVASAAWAGLSSDAWVYWPPMPSLGGGNWIMGDTMGMDVLLNFDGSSHAELDMRSYVGEFVDVALPYFNPTRQTVWTNPYEDTLGAGMMISVSQPWYFTGSFRGVDFNDVWMGAMGMDIVLQEQQALLSNLKLSENAQCLIVNDELHVMISPDSVVQFLFNDQDMKVENTVRVVPDVVPEDCQVCCDRLATDCVMSLVEANSTDWAALQVFLQQVEAGTAQATTQKLFWPAFSTNDVAYQNKSVDTLFIFDRWSVDNVKGGQWSMLCMLPADELPNSIVTTISITDDVASREYQDTYGVDPDTEYLDLRANAGDVPEGGSFTITNDGVLDLVISEISASEALTLALTLTSSLPTNASSAASSLSSASSWTLPLSLPANVGASLTISVAADTLAPSLVSGENDLAVIVKLEDDGYQDCTYVAEKTLEVHLFVLASTCPMGSYLDSSGVCLLCASGTYKTEEGTHSCQPCALGFSTNGVSGASACVACAAGYSTDNSKGLPLCVACARGTYTADEGSHECTKCPLGQYQNNTASTDCLACGADTLTLETGSSSQEECVCPRGRYWRPSSATCEPCQEGLSCEWTPGHVWTVEAQALPTLLPGYFALEQDPTNVWDCGANAKRCPGGLAGQCAERREQNSLLCSSCERGHKSSVDGSCMECGGLDFLPACFFGVGLIFLLGCVYYMADREDRAKQTKSSLLMVLVSGLTLNLYQQFTVLSMMPLSWPEPFGDFLQALTVLSFDLDVLSLNCFATVSPFVDYATRVCMVLALFLELGLIHLLVSLVVHSGDIRTRSTTLWGSAGSVFMALMLSILAGILAPMQCQSHPNGLSTMLSDDAVVCWADYFNSTDHGSMVQLSLAACLMPLAFGAIAVKAVLELPRRLKKGDAQFLRTYFFLFSRFRMEYYWYVLLMTGRNMLVAVVPALPDVTLQWCVLSLLSLASLVATTTIKPWRLHEANTLDTVLTVGLLMEMGVAALVMEDSDLDFLGWSAFAVAVLLLCCILIAGLFVAVHRLRQGKAFQYFLCHHKMGAGNFARLMKLHLVGHKHTTRKVFVDSDDLQDLSKLFSIVRNETEHLIVLGSRDVLRRYWCVGEVTIAVTTHLPIIVVALPDFQPLSSHAIEAYIEAVNMQLTPHGIDDAMMQLALEHLAEAPVIAVDKELSNAAVAELVDQLATSRSSRRGSSLLSLWLPIGTHNNSSSRDRDRDLHLHGAAATSEGTVSLNGSPRRRASVLGTRLLLCDQTSTEALCAACIIQRLLVPHLAEVAHILSLCQLPARSSHQQVILVCTNGLFEQTHVIRSLLVASEAKADFLVCTCEGSFRFPTDAFYDKLHELADACLNSTSSEDPVLWPTLPSVTSSHKSAATSATATLPGEVSSADLLVLIVKTIFEEIAVEIDPQDHEAVLGLRIQTLAKRLMDPIRAQRGEEHRSRVLLTCAKEQSTWTDPEDQDLSGDDDRPASGVVSL